MLTSLKYVFFIIVLEQQLLAFRYKIRFFWNIYGYYWLLRMQIIYIETCSQPFVGGRGMTNRSSQNLLPLPLKRRQT